MVYAPNRGDAVWLNFDPQSGREQAGRRPAIVLSPAAYNEKVGLVVACPISSRAKGYSLEVAIPAGLRIEGVILSDHVKSADWRSRQLEFICTLPRPVVDEVVEKLAVLLALRAID